MNVSKTKKINYGISILRMILSLMVVFDHFYAGLKKKKFIYILHYHIPTFFLLSFFFTYNTFFHYNIDKIKARFERLIIPYISWNIIAYILLNIYFHILKKRRPHSFSLFIQSLLNGHVFLPALWFQNILILITLILSIILFLFKAKHLLILEILIILSYFLQYSGINYQFFEKYFTAYYYITYGRLAEVLPHSISGYFIAHFQIINKVKPFDKNIVFLSLATLIFFSKYEFDSKLFSLKYGGIRNNIAAICIFIIFFFFPFKITRNKVINNIFLIITSYTPGIYFSHMLVGNGYIIRLFLDTKLINTCFGCLFIYLNSFALSLIFYKIFAKTKFRHLFN